MAKQALGPTQELELEGALLRFDRVAGSASTLVLLPGWCCSRSDWYPMVGQLADHNLLIIDLPGQGGSLSTGPELSIASMGEAVAGVVRSASSGPATLVGHSMGGAVAVEASRVLGPLARKVICVDALTYDGFYARQDEAVIRTALRPFEDDFDSAMLELVRGLFVDASQTSLIEHIAQDMTRTPRVDALRSMRALLEWDRDAALAATEVVVEIISAAAYLDPAVAARLAPRARIHPVTLGGHFFLVEQPEATAAEILSLL